MDIPFRNSLQMSHGGDFLPKPASSNFGETLEHAPLRQGLTAQFSVQIRHSYMAWITAITRQRPALKSCGCALTSHLFSIGLAGQSTMSLLRPALRAGPDCRRVL